MTATQLTHGTDAYLLRSVEIERDAEKLARMWNDSDDQWPGTWTQGVPMTAENVREWLAREQAIDILVWEAGDAIAGYCSLWRRPEEEHVTYIALLNVAPAYQKLGLARRFLTTYVERVTALGSARLDLDTWSGNLKAVPLYKKCGFFWLPGTSVDMQNYLPAILRLPVARDFFARHDWYTAFQRDLSQVEDDERWEGIKVFTYRFEADGERLTVWVDREARAITAVETDDFLAAAIADELEPARGLTTTLRWRLRNKRAEPLTVTIVASGAPDLRLDERRTVTLAPGDEQLLTAAVRVAPEATGRPAGKAAPAVRSTLVIGGQTLELATGMRPRPAVEISADPEAIALMPGAPRTARLDLINRLGREIQATVSLTPAPGLAAEWTRQTVSLPADGARSLSVTLTAQLAGVLSLPVTIEFEHDGETIRLPATNLDIFALPLGGVLGAIIDGVARIENEMARFTLEPEGAVLRVFERSSGRKLLEHKGYAAPPAWPTEFRRGHFNLALTSQNGEVMVEAAMASTTHPGLVLRQRLTVNAGPVARLEHEFENRAGETRRFQVRHMLNGDEDRAMLTLPLVAGIARGPWAVFPGPTEGEFGAAANYAERWAAIEQQSATVGVIWAEDMERVEWATLQTRLYDCPPQSRVRPAPLYLTVGEGDWRVARGYWQRLQGGRPALAPLVQARPPLGVRCEPPVAIAADGSASVTLHVEHLMAAEREVTITLEPPAGWEADAITFDTGPINWRRSFAQPVRFEAATPPAAEQALVRLRSTEIDADITLPLLRLGDGGAVEVRAAGEGRARVLTIDNGRLQLDVTPGHAAVSALREGDVNHLASPYPEVGTLGWMSPWHGGLTPILLPPGDWFEVPGSLWQATATAEPVEQADGRGIVWRGVRQRLANLPELLRGIAVEVDTLTLGGSPIVKQVTRVRATEPIRRYAAGFLAFVQPDGDRTATTVWGEDWQVKATDRIIWRTADAWVAAENPATGRTLALVSSSHQPGLSGWGTAGNHLHLLTRLTLAPGEMVEIIGYLVLTDSVAAARRWAALRHA